jgi:hypothetical protein
LIFVQPVKVAHEVPQVEDFESCRHDGINQINGS